MTIENEPSWGDDSYGGMTYYTSDDGEIVIEHEGDLSPEGSESLPSYIDLGGGFRLLIAPDAFRTIMHSPEITARVAARCEELCDVANSLAVLPNAEYVYVVSNNMGNIRARGRVKTGNEQAKIDNATHSTLLKALAQVGSDPLPPQYGNFEGSSSLPDDPMMESNSEAGSGLAEALEEE